jgi:hypothetical protein
VICCTTTRLGARSLSGSARHSVIRLWGLAATHVCHVNVSPRSFALTLLTSSRRLSFRCWHKDVFCNSSDVTGGRRGRGRWHGTNGCGHTERLCIASAVSGQRPRVSTIENLNPGKPVLSFMARHDDSEPNPREAQRDGQGAIPPDNPLRELHQEREAANDRPIGSTPAITPARSGGFVRHRKRRLHSLTQTTSGAATAPQNSADQPSEFREIREDLPKGKAKRLDCIFRQTAVRYPISQLPDRQERCCAQKPQQITCVVEARRFFSA